MSNYGPEGRTHAEGVCSLAGTFGYNLPNLPYLNYLATREGPLLRSEGEFVVSQCAIQPYDTLLETPGTEHKAAGWGVLWRHLDGVCCLS